MASSTSEAALMILVFFGLEPVAHHLSGDGKVCRGKEGHHFGIAKIKGIANASQNIVIGQSRS